MQRRAAIASMAFGGVLGTRAAAAQTAAPAPLEETLQPHLARHGMPALAAAVMRGGRLVAAGATGTRRAGAEIPVTRQDRFHIGSCTKAMTALLAGMLVEEGRIGWETTIGASFPDLAQGMDPGLAGVALDQLLSHSGGIPSDTDEIGGLYIGAYAQDGLNLDGMRRWVLDQWRTHPLAAAPGTRFAYANLGYLIAGAMLEQAGGATWEELVSIRVFDALGLATAGIGPQTRMGRVDAPLGHATRPDGSLMPMLAGPDGDAPPVLGPAGTVHLSILDFAAWAGWHAGSGRRGPSLVRPETLARLHARVMETPPRPGAAPGTPAGGGFYGRGWSFQRLSYAGGEVMTHTGSNGMNLAMILVQPERDYALVLATNRGGAEAEAALHALAETLYRAHGPAG
ncbi:MAG TPA: serine hydrolase domain-containing protein [Crenalkalicoccus sp.]|nr:serine hydrolase domain-containing protein [Crenalkalicoccus sp.]